MSRECPSCGKTMGRLVVDRARRPGAARHEFSRSRFQCPECRAELKPSTRLSGYVLQGLILVVFLICWRMVASFGLDSTPSIIVIVTGCLTIGILAVACAKYGFSYLQDRRAPVKKA